VGLFSVALMQRPQASGSPVVACLPDGGGLGRLGLLLAMLAAMSAQAMAPTSTLVGISGAVSGIHYLAFWR